MKSTLFALPVLALLLCQTSFAQKIAREEQIVAGEYFIGVDPGIGKGTPLSLGSPSTEVEVAIRDLSLGSNQAVHIRFKNAKGRWTAPASMVYNSTGVNREALITFAEYFVGTDPGPGKGTAITTSPATELDLGVNSLTLTKGQKLHVRVKDSENRWSAPVSWIYTREGTNRAASINYAEYFIGADPGRGKGTKIPIEASTNLSLILPSVSMPQSEKLHLRVRDADRRWSDPVSLPYPSRYVRNAEIVIGKRPRDVPAGTGTPMNPVDGAWGSAFESFQATVKIWNFRDSLWVRAQSSEYVWSIPLGDSVAVYPAPALTDISPKKGNRLQALDVFFTGTNFFKGFTSLNVIGTGIEVDSMTVIDPTQLKVRLRITSAADTGAHYFSVINPAPGGGTSEQQVFTVNNPVPAVTKINPESGLKGQTLDVVVTGKKFISAVTSVDVGDGIIVNSVKVSSPSSLTANLTISAAADTGVRSFSVTNAGPGGGTSQNMTFTVKESNPAPTLASISPKRGNRLETLDVVFAGTNFIKEITSINVGAGITVNSVALMGSDSLRANLTITAAADTGARTFWITNTAPGGGTSAKRVFRVNNPAPTLTKINPTSANRGQTLAVGVQGSNFISGATGIGVGGNLTVNSVTVHRTDSLTANLTIARNAAPGPRNLWITNGAPGGGASGKLTLTIINHAPTAPKLLAPADKDSIRLVTPAKPLKFVWRKSTDGDVQDTLRYSLTITGPGLDTTVVGLNDTSLALNIMPRLQVAASYNWTVTVTDGFVTVVSPEIFSFRTSGQLTGVDENLAEIPRVYLLEQNYPNPFNPATKICFELPRSERVTLKVYDVLGHELAVLLDEEMPAGRYEVNWKPSGVSSGVYFYQLRAGEFVQMRKMLLAR